MPAVPTSLRQKLALRAYRARLALARKVLPGCDLPEDSLLSLLVPASPPRGSAEDRMRILDLSLQAIHLAREIDMGSISALIKQGPKWPDIWPGEHYRLLAGFARALQPKLVVEVGTFLGLSALSLRRHMPPGSRLVTYDLIPWQDFPNSCFTVSDFADGAIEQRLGDLSQREYFASQRELLSRADLIFLDGPKNVEFERRFIRSLAGMSFTTPDPWLIVDDIRLWNMLEIWERIELPKMDLTSFGHFSGTGLVKLPGVPA